MNSTIASLIQCFSLSNNEKHCFCFDIDDTLIYTNLANFLAYQKAIAEVKGAVIAPTLLKNRCDKNLLIDSSFNLQEKEQIKNLKDKYFDGFISFTKPNYLLFDLANLLQQKYQVVFATNAQPNRIKVLIEYHNAKSRLKPLPTIFYNPSGDKYKNCVAQFNLDVRLLTIFEDSDTEIERAKKLGINNIIQV